MDNKITVYIICIPYTSDTDSHDSEPNDELMDLYWYKLEQLQEETSKVYNNEDIKWLSAKLVQEKRGVIGVCISFIFTFTFTAQQLAWNMYYRQIYES